MARRVQRLCPLRVDSARNVVENAIRAAEKAVSGECLSLEEDSAACEQIVLEACELENREGDPIAADASKVARISARCVCGLELAYGENYLLSEWHLQRTIRKMAQLRQSDGSGVEQAIKEELRGVQSDTRILLLFAEGSGELWICPELDRSVGERCDRGWAHLLETAGVMSGSRGGESRERWQRIHEAIRQAAGCFYPPTLFGPS